MKNSKIFANNFYMLRFLFRTVPLVIVGIVGTSILTSTIAVICNVILLPYIINIVLKGEDISKIYFVALAVAVYILITMILCSFFNEYYLPAAKEKMYGKIQKQLNYKAISVDITCYDNPEYYNELVWNMTTMEQKLDIVIDYLKMFPGYVASFAVTVVVFTKIDLKLLLLVSVTIFLTIVFNKPLAKASYNKENAIRVFSRKKIYIERVFKQNEFAQELRLSNIQYTLLKKYEVNEHDLENSLKKYNKRLWILNFLQVYLSGYFMVNFVIVMYLGHQIIVRKNVAGGDFIAIFNGINTLLGALYYLIGRFIRQLTESGYFIEKFRCFMEIQPNIISGKQNIPEEFRTLELINVSFSYDNGIEILHKINLKISKGERIALIGVNGVGKTTLIKLIMRLYDVSEGEILLNGINIKEYELSRYRKMIGIAFQDFQLYATSLGQNISGKCTYDSEIATWAANQCGLIELLNSLEQGLDTELMKEFNANGILLSGGNKQKVALARALYQDSDLLILDEPSASLDPLQEQHLNKSIINISKNKTVIFISHRLSTTVEADCIYVISNGKIVESGNHSYLLRLHGEYAQMWNYQAKRYLRKREKKYDFGC